MISLKKECVVAPVDFSRESFDAVAAALKLVERPEQVRVVHVLPPVEPNEFESVWTPVDPDTRKEKALHELIIQLERESLAGVRPFVLLGDTATAIADFADEQEARLVVIPSSRRFRLTQMLFGSTTDEVVRTCRCPVLVLPK